MKRKQRERYAEGGRNQQRHKSKKAKRQTCSCPSTGVSAACADKSHRLQANALLNAGLNPAEWSTYPRNGCASFKETNKE